MDQRAAAASESEHSDRARRQQARLGRQASRLVRGGQGLRGRVLAPLHGDVGQDGRQRHGHIHVHSQEAAQNGRRRQWRRRRRRLVADARWQRERERVGEEWRREWTVRLQISANTHTHMQLIAIQNIHSGKTNINTNTNTNKQSQRIMNPDLRRDTHTHIILISVCFSYFCRLFQA